MSAPAIDNQWLIIGLLALILSKVSDGFSSALWGTAAFLIFVAYAAIQFMGRKR